MSLSFVAVEVVSVTMFLLVLREAWRQGAHAVGTLLAGALFGLLVEVFFTAVYAGYTYGSFLLAVRGIPLWVALGWGTILWTSMQASDRLGAPWYLRPITDGLLALSLDLTLDPVAEALGWWHWIRPGQFFGIPYDNFLGWIAIVSFYGLAVRGGFRWFPPGVHRMRDALLPLAALLPAVLAVAGTQVVLERLYRIAGEPLVFFGVASALLGVGVWSAPASPAGSVRPWFVTVVPGAFHGLTLVLLVLAGTGEAQPELYLVLPLAAIVSLIVFRSEST